MQAISKILVAIDADEDISKSNGGYPIELSKALRLVSDKQATQLILISVGYEKYLSSHYYNMGSDYSTMQKEYLERMETRLGELCSQLKEQHYQVQSEVIWAYPRYEQIVTKAKELDVDLVIQHTQASAKLERNHFTNDTWQLVRSCPKPLLLIKEREWAQHPVLMAAVDPVHTHHKPLGLDFKILDAAITVKGQLGADLHVLHAYSDGGRLFATAEKLHEEHNKAFRELVSTYNLDEDSLHLVNEIPAFALQRYMEDLSTDIIVMGAISRSRLADAMIGNTAERVLDYLKTDVLIIKPSVDA